MAGRRAGNPGPAFASHRHNVGYRVADDLARRLGVRFGVKRGTRAEVADGRIGPPGEDALRPVLAKSRTFMNETGGAISRLLSYYKLEPAQMIVIHDELDIDPGQLRVKFGGGDNGHNGLRSIRKSLGTGDFYRVRIGGWPSSGRQDPADFCSLLPCQRAGGRRRVIGRAADAVESLVLPRLDKTQSAFNS